MVGPPPSTASRQVLHVSIGGTGRGGSSAFCHAVASHFLNLQGLAATAASPCGDDSERADARDDSLLPPLCDPGITHALQRRRSGSGGGSEDTAWVPRALLVETPEEEEVGEKDDDELDDFDAENYYDDDVSMDLRSGEASSRQLPPELIEYAKASQLYHSIDGNGGRVETLFSDRLFRRRRRRPPAEYDPYHHHPPILDGGAPPLPSYDDRYYSSSYPYHGSSSQEGRRRRNDGNDNSHGDGRGKEDYRASASRSRHVDWEAELRQHSGRESDDDEVDGEEERMRLATAQRQREQQRRERLEARRDWHGRLEQEWKERLGADGPASSVTDDGVEMRQPNRSARPPSWKDFYRTAPHSPQSLLSFACVHDSSSTAGSSYPSSSYLEIAEDRARMLLEGCDACQGVVLMLQCSSSASASAFLSSSLSSSTIAFRLLEFYGDECPSSGRLALHFVSPSSLVGSENESTCCTSTSASPKRPRLRSAMPPSPRQPKQLLQKSVRMSVRAGLELSSLVDSATAILPLNTYDHGTATAAAASLAATLEAATLPYRLHNSFEAQRRYGAEMGWNTPGEYLAGEGSYLPRRLSFPSFLSALMPTSRHCLLELDSLTPLVETLAATTMDGHENPKSHVELLSSSSFSLSPWQARIVQGTTVERRLLLTASDSGSEGKTSGRHHRRGELVQETPGAWLQHSYPRGLVVPWSPRGIQSGISGQGKSFNRSHRSMVDDDDDRSVHQHFSLLACLRAGPPLLPLPRTSLHRHDARAYPISSLRAEDYVTSFLQGMGIRFRPEHALACAVSNQGLEQLLTGSAVGAYWKALAPIRHGRASAGKSDGLCSRLEEINSPVLSVLGNSTRSHGYLSSVVEQMRDAVSPMGGSSSSSVGSVRRGCFLRDVAHGILPEEDECIEALSRCLDVRDLYRPPHGADENDGEAYGEEDF